MVLNFFNLIFWIFISTCYCIIYIRLAPSGAGSTWKEKQTRTIRWKSTQEISALQERAGGKEKPSHFKTVDTQRFKMLHRKCSAYELRRRQSGPARECTSYADDLRPIHALSSHEPDSKARKHKKDNHKLFAKMSTIGLRNDTAQTGQSFAPRCEERPECGSTSVQSDCLCSGLQMVAMVVLMMTMMTIWWYWPERQQWHHYKRDDIWSKALFKMIKDLTDMIQSKLNIWHMFEVCGVLIIFKSWTHLPCLTIFHLAIMFLDGGGLWTAAVT